MLDYAARATAYAQAVADGQIDACQWTVKACRRHLRDLERAARGAPDFPFMFDAAAANRLCGFVEQCPHVKGSWARARELLRLEDWQCFVLAVPFGWVDASGIRRFRTSYVEVPRKNAKTTTSAPVALYMLTADGEQGAELVAAATKKEQAKIPFGIGRSMARKSDAFRTEFGVVVRANSVICLETDSTFIPIDSKGSTQDGANLHFALNDEVHAWKGRDLYAVIETALGSRAQPMIWNITTAGGDQAGICYELRSYLTQILDGNIDDETFFGIVYSIDEGDDIYSERTWRKANPNYGVSVLPADMRSQANKARNNPKSRADFRMKRLNVWINAAKQYFDLDAWDKCADPKLKPEQFAHEDTIVGLDLASKRDINAAVRIFTRGDHWFLFADLWLPQARVEDGTNPSYRGWAEQGFIRTTEGNVVDYQAIADRIADDYVRDHVVRELAFDPHQAMHMVQDLQKDGVTCVEMRPTVLNFSEAMKTLDAKMGNGTLHHDGNPVMRWMIGNVVAVRDHKDNVYPRKERDENKIDGPVAAIMAAARIIRIGPKVPTITEQLRAGTFAL